MDKEIENIENVIRQLRSLKNEILKRNRLSEKAFNLKGATPRQMQKASTDLNFQCMYLDKQRKYTWKAILDANLDVSLGDVEYNPSGFHSYKG